MSLVLSDALYRAVDIFGTDYFDYMRMMILGRRNDRDFERGALVLICELNRMERLKTMMMIYLVMMKMETLTIFVTKNHVSFLTPQTLSTYTTWSLLLLLVNRKHKANHFQSKLLQSGIQCEQRSLPIGDMLWIARGTSVQGKTIEVVLGTIIERKTLTDLAKSICDLRYMEQRLRLSSASSLLHTSSSDNKPLSKIIYLLEAPSYSLNDETNTTSLTPKMLQMALIRTMVELKFAIVQTATLADTIRFCKRLHKRLLRMFFPKEFVLMEQQQQQYSTSSSRQTNSSSEPMRKVMPSFASPTAKTKKRNSVTMTTPPTLPPHCTTYTSYDQFKTLIQNERHLGTRSISAIHQAMLKQVSGMNLRKVQALANVYPTPKELLEKMEEGGSGDETGTWLSEVKTNGTRMRNCTIGPKCAAEVELVYRMQADGTLFQKQSSLSPLPASKEQNASPSSVTGLVAHEKEMNADKSHHQSAQPNLLEEENSMTSCPNLNRESINSTTTTSSTTTAKRKRNNVPEMNVTTKTSISNNTPKRRNTSTDSCSGYNDTRGNLSQSNVTSSSTGDTLQNYHDTFTSAIEKGDESVPSMEVVEVMESSDEEGEDEDDNEKHFTNKETNPNGNETNQTNGKRYVPTNQNVIQDICLDLTQDSHDNLDDEHENEEEKKQEENSICNSTISFLPPEDEGDVDENENDKDELYVSQMKTKDSGGSSGPQYGIFSKEEEHETCNAEEEECENDCEAIVICSSQSSQDEDNDDEEEKKEESSLVILQDRRTNRNWNEGHDYKNEEIVVYSIESQSQEGDNDDEEFDTSRKHDSDDELKINNVSTATTTSSKCTFYDDDIDDKEMNHYSGKSISNGKKHDKNGTMMLESKPTQYQKEEDQSTTAAIRTDEKEDLTLSSLGRKCQASTSVYKDSTTATNQKNSNAFENDDSDIEIIEID